MRTSVRGLKLISQREGNILHWYLDSSGYPTIGVGHLITKKDKWKKGDTITQAESLALLAVDAERMENAVNNAITKPMTQNEYDAFVSLAFNIGEAGFAHSSVVRKFNMGDEDGAADAILRFNRSGGKVVPGLVSRRRAERMQFLSPTAISHDIQPTISGDLNAGEPDHAIIETVETGAGNIVSEGDVNSVFETGKQKLDQGIEIGQQISTRTDSVKSIWATIGGSVVQMFWAVLAWVMNLPKEVWVVVAVVVAIHVFMYARRQNVLGKMREELHNWWWKKEIVIQPHLEEEISEVDKMMTKRDNDGK